MSDSPQDAPAPREGARPRRVGTTRLQYLARAYTQSAALFAALDLDLFTHVARGATSREALAEAAGVTLLNLERLLEACLALELVSEKEGQLENAPDVDRYLVADRDTFAGPWMNFTRPGAPEWLRLSEHLLDPSPPRRLGEGVDMSVDEARRYHEATYSVGMGAGRWFCKQVDLSGRRHLLDLGGGSGAYCINAVKTFDGLEATVLDLPGVVEVARGFIAENGVSDRVRCLAGDFTQTDFPACDVVLMASNLPMYGREGITLVVEKAFAALESGGEMHLVGEMLRDDGPGPLDAAMWGLQEALRRSEGRAHSEDEVCGYFRAAGFEDVTVSDFVPGVLKRVSGRKPSPG